MATISAAETVHGWFALKIGVPLILVGAKEAQMLIKYSQNHQGSNLIDTAENLLLSPTRAHVWTLGANPSGIMCLLDGVAFLFVALDRQNPSHLTIGITAVICSLQWLFFCYGGKWVLYLLKTHDLLHWFAWLADNQAANNTFEIAALVSTIESAPTFDGANKN